MSARQDVLDEVARASRRGKQARRKMRSGKPELAYALARIAARAAFRAIPGLRGDQ